MDSKSLFAQFYAAGLDGGLYDDVVTPLNQLSQQEHVVITESEIISELSRRAIEALTDIDCSIT